MQLPDIHNKSPSIAGFRLTRVGITNLKKQVKVVRSGRQITLMPVIDISVNLPSTQKGAHMSRNLEVTNEIVEESIKNPVDSLEELCEEISKGLLDKHEYANFAEVKMRSEYFLERKSPRGTDSLENYILIARAMSSRTDKNIETRKQIGVEAIGMTACPCAMETVRELIKNENGIDTPEMNKIPFISHNQRNRTSLIIEVPEKYQVEADDLIEIVESSFSSPTYELLKRQDEGELVLNAHKNPKFVEDVVRDILAKIIEKYQDLPDDVQVSVLSESLESIHKHNAFAERVTSLGELRK
ncbi:MAG: GTP cyclohydrolase I FolE2 [Thermoplasmata archaeon]|nr:MAG: GTP cyclohydrolase I FolE2 [Thermoplasmata archaeon]